MTLQARTLEEWLDTLASDAPTPGGGAAAAIAAATGAALIAMTARLSLGRGADDDLDARMRALVEAADDAREIFLAAADRDGAAFDAVMAAFRLPKVTDEEKAARVAAIQEALGGAAAVPLDVARRAVALMAPAVEVVASGNPNAASDACSGGAMLFASALAALANVRINAASLKDPDLVAALRGEAGDLRSEAGRLLGEIEAAFSQRLPS